ncbi:MAG: PP2C family protein-serine/threonine phosphatase [Ruminococcus sp.]|nr:PP2C family protein-serine/threonine phosphatase [Ruminococcus sp.]
MKKIRNRKLMLQISFIALIVFAATFTFSMISNYIIARNSYLESKNEMIDRDLDNIVRSVVSNTRSDWFWRYVKEHRDDTIRPYSEDEEGRRNDPEFIDAVMEYTLGKRSDYENCTPEMQRFIARSNYYLTGYNIYRSLKELKYAELSIVDFINDHEAYLYLSCDEGHLKADDDFGSEEVLDYCSACLEPISYDASEHTAVQKILAGELDSQGETLYEVWSNPDDGKDYYIGYAPVISDGKVSCVLSIKYDWSEFRSELFSHARNSMINGFIGLIVLSGTLMTFVYFSAIRPISKVKNGVVKYMEDHDSKAVADKMNKITVRNEIGTLAESFSAMAGEIERYTEENLRLGAEKERVATELSLATNIQSGMLPDVFPDLSGRKEFDIYASMAPAKEVGGDFYDFFMIDEDHLAIAIADVSGKGIPAALFMMSAMILINDHALMGGTPAEILGRINRQVCRNNKADMFVTVWLGILEISTGKLTAANAGHEYPLININGRFELLKDVHGTPIGAVDTARYRDYELTLKKGDCIFVYTDGVAEATDADNKLFGKDRALVALNVSPDASPKGLLEAVRAAVDGFVKDAPQFDDLTMLGLKYFGKE